MSLSDFIKRELERIADRPSMLEWLERVKQAKPIKAPITANISAAQLIRDLRDSK